MTTKSIPQAKKEQRGNQKPAPNWKQAEADYRAGVKTLRVIGSECGMSHVAIQKKAREESWTRDLSVRIRAKAEALVTKSAVTSQVTKEHENAVINANAKMQADVILAHRTDVSRARKMVNSMLAELEASGLDPEEIRVLTEFADVLSAGDEKSDALALSVFLKASGLGERADIMKKLADSLVKLVAAERTIYGIAEAPGGESQDEALLRIAKEDGLI